MNMRILLSSLLFVGFINCNDHDSRLKDLFMKSEIMTEQLLNTPALSEASQEMKITVVKTLLASQMVSFCTRQAARYTNLNSKDALEKVIQNGCLDDFDKVFSVDQAEAIFKNRLSSTKVRALYQEAKVIAKDCCQAAMNDWEKQDNQNK
jgi:hypothetical protein